MIDHCSLWPDRLLSLDWSICCAAHDVSALDLTSHLELGRCVGEIWPVMGVVMAAGVIVFGKAYGVWQRFRDGRRQD